MSPVSQILTTKQLSMSLTERKDPDLSAQVCHADELVEDVLGHDIGVARLPDVIRIDIYVVDPQVQVGSADSAHAPVSLGGVALLLIGTGGSHHQLIPMHIHCLGADCSLLGACSCLLLNLSDLLALHGGRSDLSSQDDVPDLRLGQSAHIHIVLLGVVCQDEVLEGDLHLCKHTAGVSV